MGGGYAHQTKGTPMALAAEINKMKVQIDALRRQIVNLGIQIDPVDNELIIGSNRSLVVNGSETVGGSLTVSGSETVSGTLDVTGPATFGGNLDVAGTLSLPNGIINNAALASPVSAGYADGNQSGLTLTLADQSLTETIAVPSGFSQAIVLAVASAGMQATGTGNYVVTVHAAIGSASGTAISGGGVGGGVASTLAPFAYLLTGLNGGTISVAAHGNTNATCVSGSGNLHISASALFLR